ncbi:hypothetical protein BpHYR1_044958 [Brachionus plicatilis]|uniref:Uncharacterized protein n=1 Tax=Brachionus plicatilis TaxID=10195 RepID=A0A3M7S0S1_BRAPC|nr:hypothetical protein BpHYR1_044958 [Brachionus plicatilis]
MSQTVFCGQCFLYLKLINNFSIKEDIKSYLFSYDHLIIVIMAKNDNLLLFGYFSPTNKIIDLLNIDPVEKH